MAYWQVEIDPKHGRPAFGECRVIAYLSAAFDRDAALIMCGHDEAIGLLRERGVLSVELAPGGTYADDSCATYEVSVGGTRLTRL